MIRRVGHELVIPLGFADSDLLPASAFPITNIDLLNAVDEFHIQSVRLRDGLGSLASPQ
jgi:phage protein D